MPSLLRWVYVVVTGVVIALAVMLKARWLDPIMGLAILSGSLIPLVIMQAWAARVHREFEFLEDAVMPPGIRKLTKQVEPVLHAAGFRHLADFRLLPDPGAHHVRVYLSPDAHTYCELNEIGNYTVHTFVSVARDATYLESSPMATTPNVGAGIPLRFFCKPNAHIQDLLEFHRVRVDRYCNEQSTHLMKLDKAKFTEVASYGHSLASIDLKKAKAEFYRPPTLFASKE